jgi:hypothetical protein
LKRKIAIKANNAEIIKETGTNLYKIGSFENKSNTNTSLSASTHSFKKKVAPIERKITISK